MRTKASANQKASEILVPINETIKRQAFYFLASPGNRAISFVATISIFYGNYVLWCAMWPWLERTFDSPALMSMCLTTLVGWVTHYGAQLVYLCIYRAKNPFFEQFKDNDRPWPWEYDREFPKQLRKALILVGINNFVVTPLFI